MDSKTIKTILEIGETIAVEFKRCGNGIEYVENANRASQDAVITPDNMEPYPKNPIIASFFRNIGYADKEGISGKSTGKVKCKPKKDHRIC